MSDIPRNEITQLYTHIAFTIPETDFEDWVEKLDQFKVNVTTGRLRDDRDKKLIYFADLDGYKFELHTGSLDERLAYYWEASAHVTLYN